MYIMTEKNLPAAVQQHISGLEQRIAELEKTLEVVEKQRDRFITKQKKRIAELEDMLFALDAMSDPPCFVCGYNGSGYFQPETHPCAERHHRLLGKTLKNRPPHKDDPSR